MKNIFISFSATLLLVNCSTNQVPETSNLKESYTVKIVGAMRNVMHKGELFGTISLDTVSDKTHLYGLGPIEYLKGEILIMDGKSYISNVSTDSALNVKESWTVKAPFFVYTNIEQWQEVDFPDSVQTIPQLEIFLDTISKQLERPFPFKMNATVESGSIHCVNLPEGAEVHSPEEAHQNQESYKMEEQQAEILGFFSTEHKGVFTHHDSYVHMHLITNDKSKMGHLDEVVFKQGTVKLYLPR